MKSDEIRRGVQPQAPHPPDHEAGFFENLLTGLKLTALVGLSLGVRGWFKAQESANRARGLTNEPNAPASGTGTNLDEIQKTLKDIEQRLDVAANPNNLSGKRQGPITR